MALSDDLRRIAEVAVGFAGPGEDLSAVIPTEPVGGRRVYLCAFTDGDSTSWIAIDGGGSVVHDRRVVRDAVSIAGMCELAEESAGGGDLLELRSQLASLRGSERPEGIEEAESAAAELEETIAGPRIASPGYLDAVGMATRRLEHALGELGRSPFAEAMKQGTLTVEGLCADIELHYKLELA
jgi:hypothetical protein